MDRKLLTSTIFRCYDYLQKKAITKQYNIVKKQNESGHHWDNGEIEGFLKSYGLRIPIEENPLQTKTDIKKLTENLDPLNVTSWAYTGGSYGEPLRVPYSKKREIIRTATFRYFNEVGGYQLGDSFALIRAKNKSSFVKALRNETIIVPYNISIEKLEEIFKLLKAKKVSVLMGYPTVMYEMALFMSKNPEIKKGLQIKNLISVSEMLEENKRAFIKQIFNCNFVDRYSNEEVGLIAQQKEFAGPYFVNKYGVYVEVVDPLTLKPVKEGGEGKVVVTDLYNDLVPIVRYETGDLAIVDKYKNGKLFTLSKILGRETEKIYDTLENPVSSLSLGPSIYKPLSREGNLFQFQFAQTDKAKYELRLKNYGKNIAESVLNEILKGLKIKLGLDAEIDLKIVDDILPQPSGKRPVYKNEMVKSKG